MMRSRDAIEEQLSTEAPNAMLFISVGFELMMDVRDLLVMFLQATGAVGETRANGGLVVPH